MHLGCTCSCRRLLNISTFPCPLSQRPPLTIVLIIVCFGSWPELLRIMRISREHHRHPPHYAPFRSAQHCGSIRSRSRRSSFRSTGRKAPLPFPHLVHYHSAREQCPPHQWHWPADVPQKRAEVRAVDKAFVQAPPPSGIATTVSVDTSSEQLRPSDAEVVPLGLPQPAELSERQACRAIAYCRERLSRARNYTSIGVTSACNASRARHAGKPCTQGSAGDDVRPPESAPGHDGWMSEFLGELA